ncbi:MAG: hypothetical protein AAF743_04900 [Planctomycetota bacterium]
MQLQLTTAITAATLLVTSAQAATVAYDGFDTTEYTAGADINGVNGGSNWETGWAGSVNYDAQATGLTYLDLETTDGASGRIASGGFGAVTRDFATSNQSGVIYFS